MRRGFTLIELVVVILILGILAAVAAPKYFGSAVDSTDNSVRQSLASVRIAIDLYYGMHQAYPGANGNQAEFKSDLAPHLRKFPILGVGPAAARDDQVAMDDKLSPIKGDNNPTEGWRYFFNAGVFIVNSRAATASDSSVVYDDL